MLAGSRDIPLMRSGSWQVGTWQPSWASSLFLTGLEVLSARWLTLSTKPCKLSSVTLHFLFMALRLFFFCFLTSKLQFEISDHLRLSQGFFFCRKFSNLNNYQFHHPIARDQFLIKIRYSILQNSWTVTILDKTFMQKNNNSRRSRQPKKKKTNWSTRVFIVMHECVFSDGNVDVF